MPQHHFRHQLQNAERIQSNPRYTLLLTFPTAKANSESIAPHFSRVCETAIALTSYYRLAFDRWKALHSRPEFQTRLLTLHHRALIGLSEPSLWQSNIALHSVYGVPLFPGSACKGLASHFAREQLALADPEVLCIFGSSAAGGKVMFHDAWWVPDSGPVSAADKPLVREQVTPHHTEFLNTRGGTPATPFDNPTPIPQIATHGKFLFVVAGDRLMAEYAMNILQLALEMEGIGARTPEYGCIVEEPG